MVHHWIERPSFVCTLLLCMLATLLPAAAFLKPSKLSRVSIDVCPLNSMYVEVRHTIQQLEEENASLARILKARCLNQGEHLDKVMSATSSVSDEEDDLSLQWDRGIIPVRLRGGKEGSSQQCPVNKKARGAAAVHYYCM